MNKIHDHAVNENGIVADFPFSRIWSCWSNKNSFTKNTVGGS
jgi:hypothetical protein